MAEKKILLIEDDADLVASTTLILEDKGYSVYSALNVNDGFEKVGSVAPDLIIMDVMMDRMSDGFDLTRKLKADERYSGIPILMTTSVGERTGFKFSVSAGDEKWLPVDDYAEKPVAAADLISRIEKLIGASD